MIREKTKKSKRLIAMLMAVMMVFTTMPMTSMTANAVTTNEDGYIEVSTIEDLYNIRDDLSANYILMNDIDLSEATAEDGDWNYNGCGWNPIGSNEVDGDSVAFTGIFDGNGYSIIGMNIGSDQNDYLITGYDDYVGLFAQNAGVIRNLKIQSANLNGNIRYQYLGAICGVNKGTITECFVDGQISGRAMTVGGITGSNSKDGIIDKCYNKSSIFCADKVNSVGGIAGKTLGTIQNCYNVGDVTGSIATLSIGGIAGYLAPFCSIQNCYNVGKITSGTSTGYAIAYTEYNSAYIKNSYYLSGTGKQHLWGTVLTETQMKLQSVYSNFDFERVWTMGGDEDYPYPELQCFIEGDSATTVDKVINSQGYIEIRTIEDLYSIRNDLTANYILMNDINLTEATAENGDWSYGGRGWNPIGSNDVYGDSAFTGVFDGNGYSIIGMKLSLDINNKPYGTTSPQYVGLFAKNAGVIRKLKIQSANLNGFINYTYLGAVCGMNEGTISECIVEGQISVGSQYVGGITGSNSKDGVIDKCYNKSSIIFGGAEYVGGIAGQSLGTIQNCYNNGDVTSSASKVGGIIGCGGDTSSSPYAKILNCYNVGKITSGTSMGYGIAQSDDKYSRTTIKNSYYLGGTGTQSEGAIVLTETQMKLQSMYSNFDFERVWTMGGDEDYPYPELQCFIEGDSATTVDKVINSQGYIEIRTIEDLYSIRNDLTANYILMSDIDLTEATAENGDWSYGGRGWNPIGSNDVYGGSAFTGVFDGNGYSIIGMNISIDSRNATSETMSKRYIGLFARNAGVISNLKIKSANLNITNYYYPGQTYVGAICGLNEGTISECIIEGQISTGDDSYVGGITGSNSEDGIIKKCYNNASFICNVTYGAGGIAGISYGTIQNCYNAGNITAKRNQLNGGEVLVGGIVGKCLKPSSESRAIIANCYNVGKITYGTSMGYGICGQTLAIGDVYADISDSYYLSGTGEKNSGTVKLTEEQMKQQSMYNNFDFETVWTMGGDPDYPYPELQCFSLSGVLGIKGDCIVFSTVTVDISQIKKVDDTFTYEWFVNGSSVGTGTSYTIKEADAGKQLSVKVVGTKEYNKGTIYSEKIIIEPDSVPGDVNDDGKINSLDGLLLMRYLNGWNVDIASPEAMDVNADGKVNSLDGLILMRYLNGWNVTLG